ncbi:MAG: ATP-binding cassette domain-containing protein [Pseudomonadota bacterium]
MLFQIRNLTKNYQERSVLNIGELDFEKGHIYALLGPNGSGKTTLLGILSLLIPPTAGSVRYEDKEIDFRDGDMTALRREIVMVRQDPILFTATVYKNIEFGLKVRGIPKRAREKMIEASLDLVGMRDFKGADAHKLSGGETQRVAIARALACDPKVMFFDEPTSNVDMESQHAIERIIREINARKNISIILTTHNLTQASRLSHRVMALFEGRRVPSVFENICSGSVESNEEGVKSCLIQDRIRLVLETEKQGPVRLSIDPFRLRIFKKEACLSGENLLKGKLTQLTAENAHIRAVVDIGIPLNILLPGEEVRDKGLFVGEEVTVFCPREAIQVF